MGAVIAKIRKWLKEKFLSITNSTMPRITNTVEKDNEDIVESSSSSSDNEIDQEASGSIPARNLRPRPRRTSRFGYSRSARRHQLTQAEDLQNLTINEAVVEHSKRRAKDRKKKEDEALKKEEMEECQRESKETLGPEPPK